VTAECLGAQRGTCYMHGRTLLLELKLMHTDSERQQREHFFAACALLSLIHQLNHLYNRKSEREKWGAC